MMMKRALFLLLVLLCTASLFAQGLTRFEFDPPRPASGEPVELLVGGIWPSGLAPHDPRVTIAAGRIDISLLAFSEGPLTVTEWGERIDLGPLPAGTYEVVVRADGQTLGRSTLVVGSAPFTVTPPFGRAGQQVLLRGVDIPEECPIEDCLQVQFDGVPGEFLTRSNTGELLVYTPAHGPGLVDVTISTPTGDLATAEDAFRYGDAIDAGDFERVLFPITYQGRGNHGSDWTTDIVVVNDSELQVETNPQFWVDLASPSPQPPLRMAFPPQGRALFPFLDSAEGRFLYIPRGLESMFSYSAHILDRSRTSTSLGAEIPVVRVKDTSHEIRLVNVPLDARYRARLRIYDWDTVPRWVMVTVLNAFTGERHGFQVRVEAAPVVCPTTPCLQPEPGFLSIDLADYPALGEGRGDIVITADSHDARLWAFVSVTNNETQQVTTYTPQHRRPE